MAAVTRAPSTVATPKEPSPTQSPPTHPKMLAKLLTTTIPAFSGPCTADICPIPTPHDAGFYLHNGQPPPQPRYTYPFGDSNPPPEIRAAYARVLVKSGSAGEVLRDQVAVAAFLKLHASHLVVRAGDGTWVMGDKSGGEIGEGRDEEGRDEEGRDEEGGSSSEEDGVSSDTDATSVSEGGLSEGELSEGEIRSSEDESKDEA